MFPPAPSGPGQSGSSNFDSFMREMQEAFRSTDEKLSSFGKQVSDFKQAVTGITDSTNNEVTKTMDKTKGSIQQFVDDTIAGFGKVSTQGKQHISSLADHTKNVMGAVTKMTQAQIDDLNRQMQDQQNRASSQQRYIDGVMKGYYQKKGLPPNFGQLMEETRSNWPNVDWKPPTPYQEPPEKKHGPLYHLLNHLTPGEDLSMGNVMGDLGKVLPGTAGALSVAGILSRMAKYQENTTGIYQSTGVNDKDMGSITSSIQTAAAGADMFTDQMAGMADEFMKVGINVNDAKKDMTGYLKVAGQANKLLGTNNAQMAEFVQTMLNEGQSVDQVHDSLNQLYQTQQRWNLSVYATQQALTTGTELQQKYGYITGKTAGDLSNSALAIRGMYEALGIDNADAGKQLSSVMSSHQNQGRLASLISTQLGGNYQDYLKEAQQGSPDFVKHALAGAATMAMNQSPFARMTQGELSKQGPFAVQQRQQAISNASDYFTQAGFPVDQGQIGLILQNTMEQVSKSTTDLNQRMGLLQQTMEHTIVSSQKQNSELTEWNSSLTRLNSRWSELTGRTMRMVDATEMLIGVPVVDKFITPLMKGLGQLFDVVADWEAGVGKLIHDPVGFMQGKYNTPNDDKRMQQNGLDSLFGDHNSMSSEDAQSKLDFARTGGHPGGFSTPAGMPPQLGVTTPAQIAPDQWWDGKKGNPAVLSAQDQSRAALPLSPIPVGAPPPPPGTSYTLSPGKDLGYKHPHGIGGRFIPPPPPTSTQDIATYSPIQLLGAPPPAIALPGSGLPIAGAGKASSEGDVWQAYMESATGKGVDKQKAAEVFAGQLGMEVSRVAPVNKSIGGASGADSALMPFAQEIISVLKNQHQKLEQIADHTGASKKMAQESHGKSSHNVIAPNNDSALNNLSELTGGVW